MMMLMSPSSSSGRVVHDDGAVVRAVVCGAWRGQLSVVYVVYQVRQLLHRRRYDARDAVSQTQPVGQHRQDVSQEEVSHLYPVSR